MSNGILILDFFFIKKVDVEINVCDHQEGSYEQNKDESNKE